MYNSLKRNLNVFHCYKKSESLKDSLFYSHPLPLLPKLSLLPLLPQLPPFPPLPLPVRLAPHPRPCGSHPPFQLVPLRGFGGIPTAPTIPTAPIPSLPVRLAPHRSHPLSARAAHTPPSFSEPLPVSPSFSSKNISLIFN